MSRKNKPPAPRAAARPAGQVPAAGLSAPTGAALPQAELQRLFGLFNTQRYAEMEQAAQALAGCYPADGQAWKAWGIALLVQGKEALATLQHASRLLPRDADLHANIGAVQVARGELEPAAASLRQALQFQPAMASAHNSLGDVLARQALWAQAEASCRQALALQPTLAAAHLNLGNALRGQNRLDEAVACYRQALTLQPRMAEAHSALGMVLKEQGAWAAAADSLRLSLQLRPQHARTQDQLGVVLHRAGETQAALNALETAVQWQPTLASAHHHLANLLLDLGRAEQAVASYRQALALEPRHAEVHVNLGAALLAAGQPSSAVAALEQALVLAPDLAPAHSQLGHLLKTVGQPVQALPHFERALALQPESLRLHSELLFMQNYLHPTAEQRQHSRALALRFAAQAARQAQRCTSWPNTPDPDKRLRIGLVSGDLRTHPVGYFLESVLAALKAEAPGQLDVVLYANHPEVDALSRRLQSLSQGWRTVASLDDAEAVRAIRNDGIDVLIDLSGHTNHNRLSMLACKPAPVQLSWLGYCATTGLDSIDAFLADPWIVPIGNEADFVEPIERLPHSFLCVTPPPFDIAVGPPPVLSHGQLTWGCFNHLAKMNDAVVALWSRVLHAVPNSRLALMATALNDSLVQQQVRARYAQHGIGADRLWLQAARPRADYLAAYGQVDITLDPFPYPGGTTTADSLWMGVPVLTLPGDSALSRQGASLLHNAGLPGWVARSADDYVGLARQHATERQALADLRCSLRRRLLASPLCDATRFAADLHKSLRRVWRRYCSAAAGGTASSRA